MNRLNSILRAAFEKATYRNAYTNPDPQDGLRILPYQYSRIGDSPAQWRGRTVHNPQVPSYLEARRLRFLRGGMDSLDVDLLDADTLQLLTKTARAHKRTTRGTSAVAGRRRAVAAGIGLSAVPATICLPGTARVVAATPPTRTTGHTSDVRTGSVRS